jgi:hypothetical protein
VSPSKIPEHVVAYGAGLLSARRGPNSEDAVAIARALERMGFGSYEPDELLRAMLAWIAEHVDADAVLTARAHLNSGGEPS